MEIYVWLQDLEHKISNFLKTCGFINSGSPCPVCDEKGYIHVQVEKGYVPAWDGKGYNSTRDEKEYVPAWDEKG